MIRHLIWDFDGTLYDTYPQMAQAMVLALGDLGCDAQPEEAYTLIKNTVYHAVCTYAERFGLAAADLQARFYARHAQATVYPPMAGMADCLRATHQLGCRHYLFTHRDRRAVEQLARDGLGEYFTDCVTREHGFADKPAPDAIIYLLHAHDIPPEQAVMIGDRDIDIQSGHAAGIRGIRFDPEHFYDGLAVEMRADTMPEITGWVQSER